MSSVRAPSEANEGTACQRSALVIFYMRSSELENSHVERTLHVLYIIKRYSLKFNLLFSYAEFFLKSHTISIVFRQADMKFNDKSLVLSTLLFQEVSEYRNRTK